MSTGGILKTVTLGCKVNQYETEYVREGLHRIGYRDARPGEAADVCVVNTCTVTATGDAKSRQIIRRLARDNAGARIIVMGCYATRDAEAVAALPGVAEVVTDKRELPDLLGRLGVGDVPGGISGFGSRHRAFVKVQDGCLLRCSYCVIPQVRPHMHSRPLGDVVDEVKRLVDNDYREIVLTGIHLGHYGVDHNRTRPKRDWVRLSHLVRRLAMLDGDFRVRLSSIEATEVTRELLDVMGEFAQRVCPHLHISMQSGSERVLRRMRRRWGSKRFIDRCRLVRESLALPALTTDVMVGFPGECDADFEQTCRVVREVGFSKLHIFPFSARPGTPAAEMPDQIPNSVKTQRARELAEIERELRHRYFASLTGWRLTVLAESLSAGRRGHVRGTSCRYAPVELPGDESGLGRLVAVTAGPASSDGILAT
jgi:threonylcarbamoyladenosine tRNA methylthiotransferase MtaB